MSDLLGLLFEFVLDVVAWALKEREWSPLSLVIAIAVLIALTVLAWKFL